MRALLAAWLVTSLATVGAAQQVELETLVERLSRDVRLLSIGGGTTEIMNEIISRLLPLR